MARRDPLTASRDIWIIDLNRGTRTRLTFDAADDLNPVWSHDGALILFTSNRNGHRDLYQKLASGTGDDQLLLNTPLQKSVEDIASGGMIIFNQRSGQSRVGIWAWQPGTNEAPHAIVEGAFDADQAQLSQNSRFIAYRSDESGWSEIYVQQFPPSGGKWQISAAGGSDPQWRRDGKELFYLAGTTLMAVDVDTDTPSFHAGKPRVVFETPPLGPSTRNQYVVASNGQRFLMNTWIEKTANEPITVMTNVTSKVRH